MQHIISSLTNVIRKGFLLFVSVCLLNVFMWLSIPAQSSYAVSTPEEALKEIQRDQASRSRQEAYREAVEISEDPKRGMEEEYEQNIEEYFEEQSDNGGVIEGAKDLVKTVTGANK